MPKVKRRRSRSKAVPEWKKNGYRSGFEYTLHTKYLKGCKYEPEVLVYNIEDLKYTPDFVPKSSKKIIIEAKGRFKTYEEARKYIHIAKSHPDRELIFIFQNPAKKAYPQCKKRKDGTVLTMAEWAEKNGFRYYSMHNIPKRF